MDMEGISRTDHLRMAEVTLSGGSTERLSYWKPDGVNERSLFLHEHIPARESSIGILFLNPILDEKKRSQRFQAQTARILCEAGMTVIRFDYFGTGDSFGASYEFDLEQSLVDTTNLIETMTQRHQLKRMHLMGIRSGADLALQLVNRGVVTLDELHLVEPVADGKRYLLEQRIRRKAFYKLNHLTVDDQIMINSEPFEDHQGFPLSKSVLSFLSHMSAADFSFSEKKIHIYKSSYFASEKPIRSLADHLKSKNNSVFTHQVPIKEFWASMTPLPTLELSRKILHELTTQN